jgi:hypothetical protein
MDIKIIGAGIGAQYLDHYEWLVRYERNGGGQYFHSVSSRAAQSADSRRRTETWRNSITRATIIRKVGRLSWRPLYLAARNHPGTAISSFCPIAEIPCPIDP